MNHVMLTHKITSRFHADENISHEFNRNDFLYVTVVVKQYITKIELKQIESD